MLLVDDLAAGGTKNLRHTPRGLVTLVLWLFLTVPWVDLQCAIVVFPDHTHLLFN